MFQNAQLFILPPVRHKLEKRKEMKSINYLFYRIFLFQNRTIGEEKSTAAFSAFLSVAMFLVLNLFTIFILFDKNLNLIGFFSERIYQSNIILPGIVILVIGVCCYFSFYHKSKYTKIISKIENQENKEKTTQNRIAIGYQIFSLTLLVMALIYRFT